MTIFKLGMPDEQDDQPLQVDPVVVGRALDAIRKMRGLPTGPQPAPLISELPKHPSQLDADNTEAELAGDPDYLHKKMDEIAQSFGYGKVDPIMGRQRLPAPAPASDDSSLVADLPSPAPRIRAILQMMGPSRFQTGQHPSDIQEPDTSPEEPRTFQSLAQYVPATDKLDSSNPGASTPAPTHLANDPYSNAGLPEAEKLANQMMLSAQLQRAGQTIGAAFSRQTVKPNEQYLQQLEQLSSQPVRDYMQQRMMRNQQLQQTIALGRLGVSKDAEAERELHDKAMIDQTAQRIGETMRHNGVAEGQGQERVDLTKDKQFVEPGDVFAPGLRLDPSAPLQERGYIQKSILEPENGFQALRGVISKLGELHKQYGAQPLPTDAQAEMIPWVKQLIANERGLLGARYMTDADMRFLKETVGDPTKWSQFFDDRIEPMLRSQFDVAINQRRAAFQHIGVQDGTGSAQNPIGGSQPANAGTTANLTDKAAQLPEKVAAATGGAPKSGQFKLSGGKWYARGPQGEAIELSPQEAQLFGLR